MVYYVPMYNVQLIVSPKAIVTLLSSVLFLLDCEILFEKNVVTLYINFILALKIKSV